MEVRITTQAEQNSLLADSQDDHNDDGYNDEEDESYDGSDGDDCNGFAEDEETGDAGDAGEAVEEDEECGSAMLGYLEARQKWMALRKARGFREPSDQGHAKKQSSFHRGKMSPGHKDGHRDSQSRSSLTGRSRDFQRKQRRSPVQKTPPPGRDRKPKGKRRGKPSEKRQGAHNEPTGAQYLGTATANTPDDTLSLDASFGKNSTLWQCTPSTPWIRRLRSVPNLLQPQPKVL